MEAKLVSLTYEVKLQIGEKIILPDAIANNVGQAVANHNYSSNRRLPSEYNS